MDDIPQPPSDEEIDAWATDAVKLLLQRCLRGLAQHFIALASGLDADLDL